MSLNRRDFVKLCTSSVAGFGVAQMFHPAVKEVLAAEAGDGRPDVIWIQGQGCTGCSVTLLDSANPTIADVLLKVISLEFHPTVMCAEGEQSINHMRSIAKAKKGQYFVVVEGAIPVAADGKFCVVGETHENGKHHEIMMTDLTKELAKGAAAVLAVGTCASFGGIPAAKGSLTKAMGVSAFLKENKIATPVVNISGCPPQPDWIVGTVALALKLVGELGLEKGLAEVVKALDSDGRPTPFYGQNVHENCPFIEKFDEGVMSPIITDKSGCRYDLGCKGPDAYCDSFKRLWNGVNWCVANATCISCTSPGFPDASSPFYSN